VTAPTTLAAALRAASLRIDPVDARVLLQHVVGLTRAQLMARAEQPLPTAESAQYADLVTQREGGVPVAYLTGRREFYGLDFDVDAGVLIPRPETEDLVELAISLFASDERFAVCDLGCGSGAICIAIAAQRPRADVWGVDASAAALAVAHRNAERLLPKERPGRFELLAGDWFAPLGALGFDLIVSNPPYVAADDPHLASGDLRFEPRSALVGGPDGLADVRHIVASAYGHLNQGGVLAVEHGYDQAAACRALMAAAGYEAVTSRKDLAGIERVTSGRRR